MTNDKAGYLLTNRVGSIVRKLWGFFNSGSFHNGPKNYHSTMVPQGLAGEEFPPYFGTFHCPNSFWRTKGTSSHDRRPSARRDTPPVNRRSERPESNLRGDRETAALDSFSTWVSPLTPTPEVFKENKTEQQFNLGHAFTEMELIPELGETKKRRASSDTARLFAGRDLILTKNHISFVFPHPQPCIGEIV